MPEGIPVSMADIIINSYIIKAMRNTTPLRLGLLSGGAMAFAMSMGAQTRPNIILFLGLAGNVSAFLDREDAAQ